MQDKMKSSGEDPMDQLPGREQRGSVRIIKKYTNVVKNREGCVQCCINNTVPYKIIKL